MRQITVTKIELAVALRKWEQEATKKNWRPRPNDESRHDTTADYLMDLIEKGRAA